MRCGVELGVQYLTRVSANTLDTYSRLSTCAGVGATNGAGAECPDDAEGQSS